MTETLALLSRFTDEAHNVSEFLITELPESRDTEPLLEEILEKWAAEHSHDLREPSDRNPFQIVSQADAGDWLGCRFYEDIVFGTTGADQRLGVQLSSAIISAIGPATFQVSDFTISDWTFCEVMVITTRQKAFLIAFLGED